MMIEELMSASYFGNTILDYSRALGIVLGAVIVGKIIYYFINRYLKKLAAKTETNLDDLIIDAIEEPIVIFIFAGGLYVALKTLNISASALPITSGIVTTIFIMDVVWLLLRLIDIVIKEVLLPITKKTDSNLDDQLIPIFSKGVKAAVVIIGLLVTLSNFGVDITALIAGLGIGGLALALASKDTVENIFGAFAILLDKPFMINDRLIIEGVTGDVMEVGLRSTRLLTLDHTELYIPNSKIVTSKVENISRPSSHLAVSYKLSVTYETTGAKLKEAMAIVKRILDETDGISKDFATTVAFTEFADSSLEILVKYWIDDYKKKPQVVDRVNMRIKEGFEKAGIEFAYPTQRVYLAK
jgi:MscS family membrane protein